MNYKNILSLFTGLVIGLFCLNVNGAYDPNAIPSSTDIMAGNGSGALVASGINPSSVVTNGPVYQSFITSDLTTSDLTTIDSASTAAAGSPTNLFLGIGSYYFFKPATNVSVYGQGANLTRVICGNLASGLNTTALGFVIYTNGVGYSNFSMGFSYGGVLNSNFGTMFYVPPDAPVLTNVVLQNIKCPLELATLDIYYSDSQTNETIKLINCQWDFLWDMLNFTSTQKGIKTLTVTGGKFQSYGLGGLNNPQVYAHCLYFPNMADFSSMIAINASFSCLATNYNGNQIPVIFGGSRNINAGFTNCVFRNYATNLDIKLTGTTIGTVTNQHLNVSGCLMDSNSIVVTSKFTNSVSAWDYSGVFTNYVSP